MTNGETRTERVERGPRWTTLALVIATDLGVAAVSTFGRSTGSPPSTTTPTSVPATTPTTEDSNAPEQPTTEEIDDGRPVSLSFPALEIDDASGLGTVAAEDVFLPGGLSFWRVDLAAGTATRLAGPQLDLDFEPSRSVRFFGPDRAVVLLADDRIALLSFDDTDYAVERVIEFGARTLLGPEFIDDAGESVWVHTDSGYLRWRLSDDAVLGRWFDLDGNLVDTPTPVAVGGDDLLVIARGISFRIDDRTVTELSLPGEPVDAAGSWILTSGCDELLRCGLLTVIRSDDDGGVALDSLAQRRSGCGALAAAGDRVLIVVQLRASSTLVEATATEIEREVALYPAGWGCLDVAAPNDETVIVSSRRGLAVVGDDRVELIQLEGTGGLVATGW